MNGEFCRQRLDMDDIDDIEVLQCELKEKYPDLIDLIDDLYDDAYSKNLVLSDVMYETDKVVFGRGNDKTDIMVIAEAPGRQEAEKGYPLIGPSGELVDQLLKQCELDSNKDTFVTNIVRLFPFEEQETHWGKKYRRPRQPNATEIENHIPHLINLLKRINPRVVICFGKIAANVLLEHCDVSRLTGSSDCRDIMPNLQPIGQLQNNSAKLTFIKGMEKAMWVIPLWHPSYLLRLNKNDTEEELKHQKIMKSKWLRMLRKGLEKSKERLPLIPEPMVLSNEEAGLVDNDLDFEWDVAENLEFFDRSNMCDYDELISTDLSFQLLGLNYDSRENIFQAFGRTKSGQSLLCSIEGYTFTFHVKIPESYVKTILSDEDDKFRDLTENELKSILKDFKLKLQIEASCSDIDVNVSMEKRLDLYGYHNKYLDKPTFIKIEVPKHWQIRKCLSIIEKIYEEDKITHYGTDIDAECMFTYGTTIRACSWVEIKKGNFKLTGMKYQNDDLMVSECDFEVSAHADDLISHNPSDPKWGHIAPHRIVAMDIECLNSDGRFPTPDRDPIISICCQTQVQDESFKSHPKSGVCKDNVDHVFCLRKCATFNDEKIKLYQFNDERELLKAWRKFIIQFGPDIISGHNVKRFDLRYIIERAEYLSLSEKDGWGHLGYLKGERPYVTKTKFSSRAFGERIIIDTPLAGIAILDTMEIYMRERKLPSYTLQYISETELGDTKNDMPYVAIPGYFYGDENHVKELNDYCRKDAALVMYLLNFRKWLFIIWEISRINGAVFPHGIYTRGQQIKVFSALVHKSSELGGEYIIPTHERTYDNTIVESWTEDFISAEDDDDIVDDGDDELEVADVDKELSKKSHDCNLKSNSKKLKQSSLGNYFSGIKVKPIEDKKKKKSDDRKVGYKGASVLDPIRGFHNACTICADFKSLYPSIMQRYNICHSKKVFQCQLLDKGFELDHLERDLYLSPQRVVHEGCNECGEEEVKIYFVKQRYCMEVFESDLESHNMDHLEYTGEIRVHPWKWRNCVFADEKERENAKEKLYVYKKEYEYVGSGLIPRTLEDLLSARKQAKKARDADGTPPTEYAIQDGRQLGLKITANSVYGATGVTVGRLADKHLGASVTAFGREAIEGTRDRALDYYTKGPWAELTNGDLEGSRCIGGDTDSWFAQYAFVTNVEEGMEFGYRCVDYQNQFFTLPMELDFEKVMDHMLVIAKKRYASWLYAGEYNQYIFEKKRWVELNEPQEKWLSIFSTENWFKDGVVYEGWWPLLGKEQKRRKAQTDEEWIADFKKPRFNNADVFFVPNYGKMFSRGIETVRRDACLFLKVTMKNYLQMILYSGKIVDAITYVYHRLRSLINGKIPKEQLLMSKQVSREKYDSSTLPHINLIEKMKKRGDKPPELGNRCPFFIIKGKKNVYITNSKGKTEFVKDVPMYLRAEHPDYVYKHNLDIDYDYYIKNQCMKPLLKVINPVLDDASHILFNITSMREVFKQVKASKGIGDIVDYAKSFAKCEICSKDYVKDNDMSTLCEECIDRNAENYIKFLTSKYNGRLNVVQKKYDKQMDICVKCTNMDEAPCNNFLCKHYATRSSLSRRVSQMKTKITDIEDLASSLNLSKNKKRSLSILYSDETDVSLNNDVKRRKCK